MQLDNWLTLTDYSSKYRVSISTLRRRIKTSQIEYKMDHGKYLLKDSPISDGAEISDLRFGAGATSQASERTPHHDPMLERFREEVASREGTEPVISTATKLLNELKRAYMNILQEKEEQIVQLKEEVTDLKTLVRVLEQDNERLRRGPRGESYV
jgi:hypothetical protein